MTEQERYAYDVFISYSLSDRAWVRDELLPRLEAAGLEVFVDYRDFEPGAPRVTEMERAVVSSRKTLLILTPVYLESEWAEFGNVMIQTLDPASRSRRFIPLLKERCDLPLRIRGITGVDLTDPEELDVAWARLLDALGASSKPEPPDVQEKHKAVVSPSPPRTPLILELSDKLSARCSVGDLKDLCFAMGIDYDNYPSTKSDFIRELLADLRNQGRLEEFTKTIRAKKPWVLRDLPPAMSKHRPELPARCPYCGVPLRPDEVRWFDNTAAECAYCQSVIHVGG